MALTALWCQEQKTSAMRLVFRTLQGLQAKLLLLVTKEVLPEVACNLVLGVVDDKVGV